MFYSNSKRDEGRELKMQKKFLSYFLSFLMIMSIFTQNTQSLYAQEYDDSNQTVEVQSEEAANDTTNAVVDQSAQKNGGGHYSLI